ncbi:MAG: restriction endonuclease subunit S [Thermocrispum sp.]
MIWHEATLADIAHWSSGGTPQARNSAYYGGSIPWAVIGDLNDSIVTSTRSAITEAGLANSAAKVVPAGTLLVAMYGSIGKLGIAGVPMATNQAIATARARETIEPKYLFYYLLSQRCALEAAGKGATQRNISQSILKPWPIRYPPSTDEQRRIVDILEDHLSRLDAADKYLATCSRRLKVMTKSILLTLIPDERDYPELWRRATVAEAGTVELGRQRHPDWHRGPNMGPYLRVANVFEDRIDTSDVMEMDWPGNTFERFRLHPGDVLLNEGQSPEFLGRPAIYRGDPPEVAFTNTLLRFKANDDVLPEFALLVFRRHMHAGRFARESRITTNIAHLSSRRLKPIEFPVPPPDVQKQIVATAESQLSDVAELQAFLAAMRKRWVALRRSLLAAAFSGRLTGAASDLSSAEEMTGA